LLDALDAITDASSDNPYLLIVEPGVYDVGTNSVEMKRFVDIQGSGTYTTVILGAIEGASNGVVNGTPGTELRWLTVENSHAGTYAVAIYNGAGSSRRITHVNARAKGSTYNYGIYNKDSSAVLTHVEVFVQDRTAADNYGIYSSSSDVTMNDVKVEAGGGNRNYAITNQSGSDATMTNVMATAYGLSGSNNRGVENHNSSPVMTNVAAWASGGDSTYGITAGEDDSAGRVLKLRDTVATAQGASSSNTGILLGAISAEMSKVSATASGASSSGLRLSAGSGSYTIVADRCTFSGGTNAIKDDSEFTLNIGASKLDGGKSALGGGTYNCVHCYDGSYVALDIHCD
jgi:hypothetical protein